MNFALAQANSGLNSVARSVVRFVTRLQHQSKLPAAAAPTVYQIADRLHEQHTARVTGDEIASTVSAWLAELGAHSPMAQDLARAVCSGDWPAAYSVCEHLSVDVTVAR